VSRIGKFIDEPEMIDRKRFLKHAAFSVAAVAGGAVLLPNLNETVSNAVPSPGQSLVGPLEQAINIRALLCGSAGGTCPSPRLLKNGRYALPATVLNDPAYSAAADILAKWSVEDIQSADYYAEADADDPSTFIFAVDNKLVRQAGSPSSLTMSDPSVFRFEVQTDDFAGTYDSDSGSRRSEIVSLPQDGIGNGTAWASFCLILGSTPGLSQAGRGIVHQWHSDDINVRRTPPLFVDAANSELTIRSCSSAQVYGDKATASQHPENGIQVVHYSTKLPAKGEHTFITLQATFGEGGHLNAWINGVQVVDTDTPIGYYDDLADGSGRLILGYPHWGLYTTNGPDTQVVYVANPEWDTNSLAERVNTPLPVPDVV
jgi:hypothetical protein